MQSQYLLLFNSFALLNHNTWYSIVEFNVPLDTSETGGLSSDVQLSFSNGGPAT